MNIKKELITWFTIIAGSNLLLANFATKSYSFPILGEVTPVYSRITCYSGGGEYDVYTWMSQNKLDLIQQNLQHNDIIYGVDACQ